MICALWKGWKVVPGAVSPAGRMTSKIVTGMHDPLSLWKHASYRICTRLVSSLPSLEENRIQPHQSFAYSIQDPCCVGFG